MFFCAERISLTSYQVVPDGGWSKFNDTRIYHAFCQDFLEERARERELPHILPQILVALRAINLSFRTLYQSGLWMTREEAHRAGTNGRAWLRAYVLLATKTFESGGVRFPLVVKHHALDHIWRSLVYGASSGPWTLNPLAESVQLDEDAWLLGQAGWILVQVRPHSCITPPNSQNLRTLSATAPDYREGCHRAPPPCACFSDISSGLRKSGKVMKSYEKLC